MRVQPNVLESESAPMDTPVDVHSSSQTQRTANVRNGEVDVGSMLGQGEWSIYQKYVLGICALAIILDAFDNQVLSFAIPALIAEWGVTREVFAPILAVGLIAMSVGTALAGVLGDRFGRRGALVASVFVFGVATAAIGAVNGLLALAVLRIIAGLGVGGAIPNAIALIAEYTPNRHRTMAVTMGMICVPLGGTICGVVAAFILPSLGWRALFLFAGLSAVVVAIALFFILPESPRYLVRRSHRHAELREVLAKMKLKMPSEATFVDREEQDIQRASLSALLGKEQRRDTLAVWVAFFFCLLATYTMSSWAPTMLTSAGFTLSVASSGLAAFNFGGVFGALAGAYAINRFGSRVALMTLCAMGAAGALLMMLTPILSTEAPVRVVAALALEGALINGAQTTLFALAAYVYPTAIRSSGVGGALAVGRLGAVLSSFTGAAALAAGGSYAYFGAVAMALGIAMLALAVIVRHIPRLEKSAAVA
jgi:AAHS family 4-hydroxybenzoate transporter-like MFS transporter